MPRPATTICTKPPDCRNPRSAGLEAESVASQVPFMSLYLYNKCWYEGTLCEPFMRLRLLCKQSCHHQSSLLPDYLLQETSGGRLFPQERTISACLESAPMN